MHIAVFLQYYHTPDCPNAARPYALVERLGQEHDVTVITTRAWEDKRCSDRFPWAPPGVKLVRFDIPYDNSMSPLERLRAFLLYSVRAGRQGLSMRRPDLIIGSSTPLTAALTAGLVAAIRDVPWIFEVRDLWPAFPIQMGVMSWPGVTHALRGLETQLYRRASHVATLSPDMEKHVSTVAPGASVTTVPYGSDLRLVDEITEERKHVLRERLGLDDRFLVLYAGTLGRANAIPTILGAAKQFDEDGRVQFAFAGHGYYESSVREAAEMHDHIHHLDPLAYPNALVLFSIADLSLVPFIDRPVLASNAPGKFYDSLAAGTPVIVTNPGWTKRFVERHGCGWYVPPESPKILQSQIRDLSLHPDRCSSAGRRATRVAKRHFDRSQILDDYAELVTRVAQGRGPTSVRRTNAPGELPETSFTPQTKPEAKQS